MKLLITTQAVDIKDPTLGFFHRWLIEFSKHVESIEVICLYEGEHDLPENVHIHSLGKEQFVKNHKTGSRLLYALRFIRLSHKLKKDYDTVFVHMNPEYVLLCGLSWKRDKKPTGLWYLHKSVDLKLRLAEKIVTVIFTASKESFRLKSTKVNIVGHGIDTDVFSCPLPQPEKLESTSHANAIRIVTVGRLTRAKNVHVLLEVVRILAEQQVYTSFDIIGAPVKLEDITYEDEIKRLVGLLPEAAQARLLGPKDQEEVAKLLCDYVYFIHASTGTGSVDKAVLEALASGVIVISTSEAFKELLSPHGLYVADGSAAGIAAALMRFHARSAGEKVAIRTVLRNRVVEEYSLSALIPRILGFLKT